MFRYTFKYINIPCYQGAFRYNSKPEAEGVDKLGGVSAQKLGFLKGIIGVAHRACSDNARLNLTAQLVPQDFKGVFLFADGIKILYPVALASAVAVDTAVAAALVEIHIVVVSEPVGAFVFLQYGFSGYCFHKNPPAKNPAIKSPRT